MAKLPTLEDLGATPRVSGDRPIADISGAGAAMAKGTEILGTGIAKAGTDLAQYAFDQARYRNAVANSDFTAKDFDRRATLSQDTNYSTMVQRYEEGAVADRDEVAKTVPQAFRDRFVAKSNAAIAHGKVWATNHAKGLERQADVGYLDEMSPKFQEQALATDDPTSKAQIFDTFHEQVDAAVGKGTLTPAEALHRKQTFAHQYATADLQAAYNSNDPVRIESALNRLKRAPSSQDQLLDRIIQIESGGNPNSRSTTSSAFGVAQFLATSKADTTWRDLLAKHHPELIAGKSPDEIDALRADRNLSREMLGKIVEQNRGYLSNKGIETTPGNIYLTHFLGPKAGAAIATADPRTPVADVLGEAVGPQRAQAFIAANRSVLGGQLAGTVKAWADRKMGGTDGGHVHDILRLQPDVRERMITQGEAALAGSAASRIASFNNSVKDDLAEADRTGTPSKPKSVSDFIAAYGAEQGVVHFRDYQAHLEGAADIPKMQAMSAADINAFLAETTPREGAAGYAAQAVAHEHRQQEAQKILKARKTDPADAMVAQVAGVRDAFQALLDPATPPDQRTAAARDYATKTTMWQQRLGIAPDAIRLVPKAYADHLVAELNNPQATGGAAAVAKRLEAEAKLWGDHWPEVSGQIQAKAAPLVRVLAAGTDAETGSALVRMQRLSEGKLLQLEDTEKRTAIDKSVREELARFNATLPGPQGLGVRSDYFGMAERLATMYVAVDGMTAPRAAAKAVKGLVDHRYTYQDDQGSKFRIPVDAPGNANAIVAGAAQAKRDLAKYDIAPALNDMPGVRAEHAERALLPALARDGKWVTSPKEDGLIMLYADKPVRSANGAVLVLPWGHLAKLGAPFAVTPPTPGEAEYAGRFR